MESIVLVGAGRHCNFITEALRLSRSYAVCGVLDPKFKKGEKHGGAKVLGDDGSLPRLFASGVKHAFVCIGSIGDCTARVKAYEKLVEIGFELPVIKHPASIVAESASLAAGVFVDAGAVIAPEAAVDTAR